MSKSNVIALLDAEIERLQQARRLLSGGDHFRPGRTSTANSASPTGRTRRRMSAEAKRRISLAQKKRWAARKKASKQAA